jgi:hypothetical protein
MENAGLAIFPQIGIFLFLTGFALARMPLDD